MDNWTNEFAPSKMKVKTMGQSEYNIKQEWREFICGYSV